jgi:putative transposase
MRDRDRSIRWGLAHPFGSVLRPRLPHPCVLGKGGLLVTGCVPLQLIHSSYVDAAASALRCRLSFITTSCYQRRALLGTPRRRDLLVKILEEVRQRYHFVAVGYVVMPEHMHLLVGEPERGNPSVAMQVLKQRFARALLRTMKPPGSSEQGSLWAIHLEWERVWQRRFYDFVVWSQAKIEEKIRYMHANPVKRGLVLAPEQWRWSSTSPSAHPPKSAEGGATMDGSCGDKGWASPL